MGSFWTTYRMFKLKKYRGVIFHDAEEWCKTWRKTDLWFKKWHKKFGNFSPEHSKVSKLELWLDPFFQSRKCMILKLTEELCAITMKNHAKFQEKLTCNFKLAWGISQNLTRALENLKHLLFNWPLWPKYIKFKKKKYGRFMFDGTEDWCKIWRKIDLCFQN